MGRILVLDGAVQFSTKNFENDHYTWDMTHGVISKDKSYDKVLIIGGGDLIIAAYILTNYPLVKKLVVVEIDERVVEVTKKFFSFADVIDKEIATGRLEVVSESGASYIDKMTAEGQENVLDGVIIDCTDFAEVMESIAAELFSP